MNSHIMTLPRINYYNQKPPQLITGQSYKLHLGNQIIYEGTIQNQTDTLITVELLTSRYYITLFKESIQEISPRITTE